MEPSNSKLNKSLEALAAAGRLRVVLDFKLEDVQFIDDGQVGAQVTSIGDEQASSEPEPDAGLEEPLATSDSASGEPLYELNPAAQPPRVGSMNFSIVALLKQLPPTFTRGQFEGEVSRAMNFNPKTGYFGVRTNFPTLKRAQQAYFSEFRKRQWIMPFTRGVTLTARLLDDGTVITCITGVPVGHPAPSKPQHFDMLTMFLDHQPLSLDEKEAFLKSLRENRTGAIFVPRYNSTLLAG